MRLFTITTLLFVSVIYPVLAQSDKWTPEEIINTDYVSGPVFSPNGEMVVWTQKKGLTKEDKFVNDFYLARLSLLEKGKIKVIHLTNTNDSDHSPLFDKKNEYLYFLSSRKEGKKLWRLNMLGGEPEEVQEFKNGISSISWLDEKNILFVSSEGKSLYDIQNEKDNTQIIEDTAHWQPTRLYAFNIETKKTKRITNNRFKVSDYAVSRNGNYLVYRLTTTPDFGIDGNPKPQYFLKDLKSGEEKEIVKGLQGPSNFQFTASSSGFYFLATKSSNPEWEGAGIEELYYYDLILGDYKKVPIDWEKGIAYSYFISGEDVVAQLANGPLKEVVVYRRSGQSWQKLPLDFGSAKNNHVSLMNISENGKKLIYTYSTASRLPEYFITDIGNTKKGVTVSNEKVLTSLNDKLKKKKIAKSEIIYWKGALDEEVNGILYYPKNYEAGKQYPLILSIHGGPTGVDQDSWSERWSTYPQIYTEKGAFVLKPNYHGSGQHSLAFIESIKNGNYYHLEQIDLYNGIMHLKEKGMVDMNKLGLMGWSNGAILTTWMTLKYPDMFKVAAPGAGDINWTSDYGTCQFGVTFDQSYFGGAPWDDTNGKHYNEWYINNSPIFEIEKIKTPTIIFHGSEDRAVPRDQGWEYYRGLQQVGVAPVKFLWFPGQPHGLQKLTHQLRKMKEEIKWIDQYLFEIPDTTNESFKKDSPLATQLLLQTHINNKGYYGVDKEGKLLPETVSVGKDSIALGKFEVTVAQYYIYLGKDIPENEGNLPIRGLSKTEIEGYLNWITDLTGVKYRLPNAKEAKALHQLSRKSFNGQNNLNYWSGYQLTAYDVKALKIKLEDLEISLIKPVGTFQPVKVKDVQVFDLGGNVGEYYLDGTELKVYDYSAYDFVDPHIEDVKEDGKHTGFRVVVE
ncbi:MAG: S9 family peptidase [Cyclobacteriaceae bacterium]|nr:S9 family peptidase [Cyclobacteriaceae bacterium]